MEALQRKELNNQMMIISVPQDTRNGNRYTYMHTVQRKGQKKYICEYSCLVTLSDQGTTRHRGRGGGGEGVITNQLSEEQWTGSTHADSSERGKININHKSSRHDTLIRSPSSREARVVGDGAQRGTSARHGWLGINCGAGGR